MLYKVVHIDNPNDPNTSFSSCFAGQPIPASVLFPKHTYEIGKVTIGQGKGVFVWDNLERAIRHAKGESGMTIHPPCAVLEVEEVQVQGQEPIIMGSPLNLKVRAVAPIRIAWKPEPKYEGPFKVGQQVTYKERPKELDEADPLIITDITPANELGKWCLKFKFGHLFEDECLPYKAPAPEPKWEDITDKCHLELYPILGGYQILVQDHSHPLHACPITFGAKVEIYYALNGKRKEDDAKDYKVELDTTYNTFKILKRLQ